jgi:hypothetical protein
MFLFHIAQVVILTKDTYFLKIYYHIKFQDHSKMITSTIRFTSNFKKICPFIQMLFGGGDNSHIYVTIS